MKKYTILIKPFEADPEYQATFETDNIEFTMDQYQRNRPPFHWEVLSINSELDKVNPRQTQINFDENGI